MAASPRAWAAARPEQRQAQPGEQLPAAPEGGDQQHAAGLGEEGEDQRHAQRRIVDTAFQRHRAHVGLAQPAGPRAQVAQAQGRAVEQRHQPEEQVEVGDELRVVLDEGHHHEGRQHQQREHPHGLLQAPRQLRATPAQGHAGEHRRHQHQQHRGQQLQRVDADLREQRAGLRR